MEGELIKTMGRCMRKVNEELLSRMKEYVSDEDRFRDKGLTHKVFLSENVYQVLEKLEIFQSSDFKDERLSLLKYDGVYYVATKSCDSSDEVFSSGNEVALDLENNRNTQSYYKEGSGDHELNDGDILIAINYLLFLKGFLDIELKSLEMIENYFGWEQPRYFYPNEVIKYFTPCRIYVWPNDSELILKEDLERWDVQLSIFERESQLKLEDKENYLQETLAFLSVESSRSVVEIVRDAIFMDNPKSVYLQFFRALEYLFILRRGIAISNKYSKLDRDELIKHYSKDGFWEREDESVKQLIFHYCSEAVKQDYINYLCSINYINLEELKTNTYFLYLKESGKTKEAEEFIFQKEEAKLAEYIWQSRNNIAHYRYGQSEIKGEHSLRNSIKCLVKMITSIYENLDDVINEIHKNTNAWHEVRLSMN